MACAHEHARLLLQGLAVFDRGYLDVQFEEIKAMEPAKYIGDSFERVSRILVVTLYNIACCYSALKVADAGLEALEECLRSGFDDYDKVCSA